MPIADVKAMSAYLVNGRHVDQEDPAFPSEMAMAHLRHARPRCLCRPDGIEMYVAKARHKLVLKRMPYTGPSHAPICRSFAADIPLAWIPGHASRVAPRRRDKSQDVLESKVRHLQQLMRALWRDAELTRWRPGFEGRRSWATVRRHLLAITAMQDPDDEVLRQRLYVPEFFRVDDREAIRARRLEAWQPARESTVGDGAGIFMIGELKKILPRSHDFEVIVKHVPDETFAIANDLYRWLSENLAAELNLWATSAEIRMIVVAWFCVPPSGKPVIECLGLVPVSPQWLPVESLADLQRIQQRVRDRHSFVVQ